MKIKFVKFIFTAGIILTLSGICLNLMSQDSGKAVKLAYNYPADKAVKYLIKNTMAQIMEVEGQTMQTDVNSAFGCSVKSAGNQDNNLKIEITIDSLGQTTNSPMGTAGGEMESVKGKICNIIISPTGKPVDMTEAVNIVYSVEGSGESNMTQTLSDFFPLLPDKPVAPGDSWNSIDSVSTKSASTTMKTIDSTFNKLEGFETLNGIECAKISSEHSGKFSINVQSQGMDIYINGPFKGTSECLFAVKEGYFIKNTTSTKMSGNLDIISMGMSMPITMDMKSVNEIVR